MVTAKIRLVAGPSIFSPVRGLKYSGSGSVGDSVVDGKTGYDRGYAGGMAGTGEYKAFGLDVSSWQGSSLDFNRIKNGEDYVTPEGKVVPNSRLTTPAAPPPATNTSASYFLFNSL